MERLLGVEVARHDQETWLRATQVLPAEAGYAYARVGDLRVAALVIERFRAVLWTWGPPRLHGPYWQWTRKIAARTICRWLNAEQHDDFKAWVDNDRRLRELLTRLEALGAAALEADPRLYRQRRGPANRAG